MIAYYLTGPRHIKEEDYYILYCVFHEEIKKLFAMFLLASDDVIFKYSLSNFAGISAISFWKKKAYQAMSRSFFIIIIHAAISYCPYNLNICQWIAEYSYNHEIIQTLKCIRRYPWNSCAKLLTSNR